MDERLAKLTAVQQLAVLRSKKTDCYIADMKILNGRGQCFVHGHGWILVSDLLAEIANKRMKAR